MREIKFRAQRIDNREWVYGSYTQMREEDHNECFRTKPHKTYHRIWQWEAGDWNMGGYANYEVIPVTLCQFTGLKDIDGVDIYEGDIIKQQNFNGEEYTAIYQVCYDLGSFCLQLVKGNAKAMKDSGYSSWSFELYAEDKGKIRKGQVIGNIHDNPELLN